MSTQTINGARASAYPRPIEELMPEAIVMARKLGEIPSRNALMREFRIGAPKADELRARLLAAAKPGAAKLPPPTFDYAEPIGPDPLPAPAGTGSAPVVEPDPTPTPAVSAVEPSAEVTAPGHPGTPAEPAAARRAVVWPVVLLALPAFVAIWSGWVGLGGLTGFGVVHPLPGIWDDLQLNTAITLPVGVETYGAYALYVWLSGRVPDRARQFAKWSALASLVVGALGQVAYHLLVAAGVTSAPWWITTAVSCLPVAVLGMGAALAHLVREGQDR